MNKPADPIPTFEAALAELERLVTKLESGEAPLDESLADFRQGVELTRQCQAILERAQQTVEQLLDPDNEASAAPFDPDE